MKKLFDTTGIIQQIADYVAYPEHPYDDVCFYGMPFAKDKQHITKIRERDAKRITNFSYMNHCGLNSNCSSFAEFLRSGNAINIRTMPSLFSYFGNMFNYKGQHLNYGDTIAIHYLRNQEFSNGLFASVVKHHFIHDFAEKRMTDALATDFLKTYSESRKHLPSKKKYTRDDLLKIEESIFFDDYHFLVCVGYEINSRTGNLEPVFVCQNERNIFNNKETADGEILLPPFGNIRLAFFSDYVKEGKNVPAFVFCSKPA